MRTLTNCALGVLLAGCLTISTALAQDAAAPAASEGLAVAEMAVGTGYDRDTRSLAGEAVTFPAATERLWCRTRITGAAAPTTVAHVWYHEGTTMARIELNVASGDWRTVSSKALLPAWTGAWEVKVLDASGTVLHAISFTIE